MCYKTEILNSTINMSSQDLGQCVDLISDGGAVERRYVKENFPCAHKIVTVTCEGKIVGAGAIKQIRKAYASGIASKLKSGHSFPPDTHELGYITVHAEHRRQGLSGKMVAELLSGFKEPLFATTSSKGMAKVLCKAGFSKKGNDWQGKSNKLSLWIKGPE